MCVGLDVGVGVDVGLDVCVAVGLGVDRHPSDAPASHAGVYVCMY